ncbi:MAG: aldo/keto reductase [Deltaproteobacteria bacterium]|nr:aldo/keto reductase [Deltaproteobacteria bacterium]MBN2673839.1 aldo/keto reductase [Deltaproteobacteria bacterium]
MGTPNEKRYENCTYHRIGRSGLKVAPLSLGLWHNFGGDASYDNCREMVLGAFDLGITHFDLANNYGPPPGSAEKMFGRILKSELAAHRNELLIATKAGYDMWPGPYGDFGSRKYLLSSLDDSLRRMGVDYVDIFYHHRPDPDTPLAETMGALDSAVRSGKALYVGLSNYNAAQLKQAYAVLAELKTPFVVNQVRYNMFDRAVEKELVATADELGIGLTVFSPLAQGMLTERYLQGVPADSRAGGASVFLNNSDITADRIDKVRALGKIAASRGQTIAQLALAFVLRHASVSSVIVGASRLQQIVDCFGVTKKMSLSAEELIQIETILS